MSIIRAGYKITVDSYENDGDNTRTLSIDGIQDKEFAQLLFDVMNLLGSRWNHNGAKTFGNLCEPDEEEYQEYIDALSLLCEQHDAGKFFADPTKFTQGLDAHEYLHDFIYELHGGSEYYTTRVTDSIKVEFIPEAIVIQDVTEEFKHA